MLFCIKGIKMNLPLHIIADKREIKDSQNCLRQLLLSARRYMKFRTLPRQKEGLLNE